MSMYNNTMAQSRDLRILYKYVSKIIPDWSIHNYLCMPIALADSFHLYNILKLNFLPAIDMLQSI